MHRLYYITTIIENQYGSDYAVTIAVWMFICSIFMR